MSKKAAEEIVVIMKVCQASNTLPGYHENWGGAEKECVNLADLLDEKELEICFLTIPLDRKGDERKNIHEIATVRDLHYSRRKVAFKLISILTSFTQFDPVSFWHSYKALKKCRPHILHFHNIDILSLSPLVAAKLLHIPIVWTLVDYWCICQKRILINEKGEVCHFFQGSHCVNCLGLKRVRDKVRLYLRAYIFDLFLKMVDAFVCLSKSSARILCNYGIGKGKVCIIHQPLVKDKLLHKDSQMEEPGPKRSNRKGRRVVLFIGWVRFHKGLHVVIKALPEVVKRIPNVVLFVIENQPDEEYKRDLKRFIEEKGLEGNVVILEGKKSSAEIRHLYNLAEVVVIPEQWENMSPVTLMEASLYSKPIMASRIGGIPEFIKDGESGLLAEPTDSRDWARKIIHLLEHPDEARRMGERGRIRIQKMADAKRILVKMQTLYAKILIGKG